MDKLNRFEYNKFWSGKNHMNIIHTVIICTEKNKHKFLVSNRWKCKNYSLLKKKYDSLNFLHILTVIRQRKFLAFIVSHLLPAEPKSCLLKCKIFRSKFLRILEKLENNIKGSFHNSLLTNFSMKKNKYWKESSQRISFVILLSCYESIFF